MIVQVSSNRSKRRFRIAVGVQMRLAESFVSMAEVGRKIEIMLDQQRACERVISDSISAHPWIQERERHKQQQQQDKRKFRGDSRSVAGFNLLFHYRATHLQR